MTAGLEEIRWCTLVWDPRGREAEQLQALHEVVARIEIREVGPRDVMVVFDLQGPRRRHGGESEVITAVTRAVRETGGTRIGAGVGSGRLVSWAAGLEARHRGGRIVIPAGDTDRVRERLPVRVLADPAAPGAVPLAVVEVLERLGLERLGAVAALSAGEMTARFAAVGRHLWDLATGVEGPVAPVSIPERPLEVERLLDDPVEQVEALVFLARGLAEEVCDRLGRRGEIATGIAVVFETEHAERIERSWFHAEGLGVSAMVDRVRWGVQGWRAGPVVVMRLIVEEVVAARGHQPDWWGGRAHQDRRAEEAVARVVGLLGVGSVTRARWQGGRDPVTAYDRCPPSAGDLEESAPGRSEPAAPWPGALPAPSPAQVHDPVRGIRVLDAAGEMVGVSGRGEMSRPPARLLIEGEPEREVVVWFGPWPVEERWWRPESRRRLARLQVVTADGEAFLIQVEAGAWWLRGRYR